MRKEITMDNKEFDKLFSDKLNETQSFDFDESGWNEVAEQIRPEQSKKRPFPWFWLFAFALLSLGGVCAYLMYSLHTAHNTINSIEEKLSLRENTKEDNSIEKTTLVLYDTIYKTVIIEEQQISNKYSEHKSSNNNQNKRLLTSSGFTQYYQNAFNSIQRIVIPSNTIFKSLESQAQTQKGANAIEERNEEIKNINPSVASALTNTYKYRFAMPMQKIDPLSLTYLKTTIKDPIFYFDSPKNIIKKKIREPFIDKFSIGLLAGVAQVKNNFDINDLNIIKKSSWNAGLRLAYQFTDHINVWSSISYMQQNYQETELDSLSRAPDVYYPSSFNEIDRLELINEAMQVRLGLNYRFLHTNRWRTYIGLSTELEYLIRQNSTVYYTASYSPTLLNISQVIKTGLNEQSPMVNTIIPTAGFEFDITPKLTWRCEAWFKQELKTNTNHFSQPFGIQTGISYNFSTKYKAMY